MKPLALIAIGMALVSCACVQVRTSPSSLEQEIRGALDALGRAVVERDVAAIERLVAADFTVTQPDAVVSGKRELLAGARPGSALVYLRHEVLEIAARDFGATAVSTGRFAIGAKYEGNAFSETVRFTAVHALRDAGWQRVALQSTIEARRQ